MSTKTAEFKIKVDTNYKTAEGDAKKFNAEANKTNEANKDLKTSTKGASNSFLSLNNVMKGFAIGAVLGGVKLLSGAFTSLVTTFSGFSKELSGLQAVSGASSGDMKELSDQAKALGSSTQFTAKEVVSLQTELAKLGFTTKEITEATGATLDLASSLDVGLGEAASLAGSTLRAFGLDASETGKIVDVMAKSSASSALDFESLKESLKLVAPTARAMNVSVEESTALLAVLADNGLKGSIAGTGLSKTFIKLNEAGIPLSNALEKVKNSSNQLNTAIDLVGIVGAKSLLTLANNAPKIDTLTESFNNAEGSARKLAETRLDNLAGDTTKLGSAWEGFLLSIEDGEGFFSNLLRGIVQATTGLLNFLNPTKQLSDALKEEQVELFKVEAELGNVNTTQERRNEIIADLQASYPDYLGNIDAETVSNEELYKALEQVNAELVNKIVIQTKQEEIEEQARKTAEKSIDLIDKRNLLTTRSAEIEAKYRSKGLRKAKDGLTQMERAIFLETELVRLREKGQAKGRVFVASGVISDYNSLMSSVNDAERKFNKENEKGNELLKAKNEIMAQLGMTTEEVTKVQGNFWDSLKDRQKDATVATGSLIEAQQALLDQAKLLPETTERELSVKNRKIQLINVEIKRLKALGVVEKKKAKDLQARLILEQKAREFNLQFTKDTSDKELKFLIKNAQKLYNESLRINKARIDAQDAQDKLAIDLLDDGYEKELAKLIKNSEKQLEIAKGNKALELDVERKFKEDLDKLNNVDFGADKKKAEMDLDLFLMEDGLEKQKLLLEKSYEDKFKLAEGDAERTLALTKKLEAQKEALERKANINKVKMASDAFGALSSLMSSFNADNEEDAKKQFKITKALNLAQAVTNTALAVTGALTAGGNPVKLATGMQFVEAGIAGATGLANIVKIAGTQFEGASGGGIDVGSGSAPSVQAPNFNIVGDSGINQIASIQGQPMQAYVVSGEVSSQQALDRNRQQNATL